MVVLSLHVDCARGGLWVAMRNHLTAAQTLCSLHFECTEPLGFGVIYVEFNYLVGVENIKILASDRTGSGRCGIEMCLYIHGLQNIQYHIVFTK